MKNTRHIGACLLDLYDTLVEINCDAYTKKSAAIAALCCVSVEDYLEAWKGLVASSNLGEYPRTKDRVIDLLARLNVPADERLSDRIADMEHEFLRKSARFVEGATATLEELRHRGIRLALVTNASPSVNVVLKTMDLDPLVDVVVISSEIGVRKPDPEIYLEALRRIDSEAVNAAFVGDGNDCELDGAKKLGMTTVWLRRDVVRAVTSEQSTLASADYTIDALSALPPLLLDEILPQ